MEFFLQIFLLGWILTFRPSQGQTYTTACGIPLQDIPNPSSDTCTAFFRCFNNRQYSLRCPLGQAFNFDRAGCRPEAEVDCPLQLQRFQAPPVPPHLRSPGAPQEREVEIRVVHVGPGVDPNNLQFYNNGRPVTVARQPTVQRGGHTLIAAQQQQQAGQSFNVQQMPVLLRTPDGQVVQGQTYLPIQGQVVQGQPVQSQPTQGLVIQGQSTQGQTIQGQPAPGFIIQGQPTQGQTIQGQPGPGFIIQGQPTQGQPVQGYYPQQPLQAPIQVQG